MKKKVLPTLICALLGLIAIGGIIFMINLPVTYKINRSEIKKNPDYNVEVIKSNGYTTLIKKDSSGNVTDEPFKVMAFTDTHLDAKPLKPQYTMDYLIRDIVYEKPDLVLFVGDNITGPMNGPRTRQFCRVMESLGVYWDCVLGNHEGDNAWSITREQMVKIFSKYPHCLMEADTKKTSAGETVWGNGNHVINLMDSKGKITRSIFFIDGGGAMSAEDMQKYDAEFTDKNHNDYDYVKDSQITWYLETVADIERINGGKVKSMVLDHIPLPEFKIAYDKLVGEGTMHETIPEYGKPDADGDEIIMGLRREVICCSGHNSGFFDAILKAGSTDLFVSGHDHVNDFVLRYKGVVLSYNTPSGYSGYSVVSKGIGDKLLKGYTRYIFNNDGTYTREQICNADLYPEAQAELNALYK